MAAPPREESEAYCGGHKKRNVAVEAAEGIVQMSPVTVMLGCVAVAFALPVVIRRLPSGISGVLQIENTFAAALVVFSILSLIVRSVAGGSTFRVTPDDIFSVILLVVSLRKAMPALYSGAGGSVIDGAAATVMSRIRPAGAVQGYMMY
jgi:hypothetical protein